MSELLYGVNSAAISLILLSLMIGAMLAGRHLGRRAHPHADESTRGHANSTQGALLGLMALLIGFSFSMSIGRFDARTAAVVDEANAIGTAWLRTDLLPEPERSEVRDLLRRYMAERLKAGTIALDTEAQRVEINRAASAIAMDIWEVSARAARNRGAVQLSFAEAINAMIDSFGSRDAALRHHVPEVVTLVLFAALVIESFGLGYCVGIGNARNTTPLFLMVGLTVLIVYLIVDLDRPRRGLITVDQSPMTSLAKSMDVPAP